jgi:hypothetical protein
VPKRLDANVQKAIVLSGAIFKPFVHVHSGAAASLLLVTFSLKRKLFRGTSLPVSVGEGIYKKRRAEPQKFFIANAYNSELCCERRTVRMSGCCSTLQKLR